MSSSVAKLLVWTAVVALSVAEETPTPLGSKYPFGLPPSHLGIYTQAAVAADAKKCAPLAVDILKQNGTAVDAAIITLLCNGVIHSHSMGLGGGFFMTIFKKDEGKAHFLDAREVAPLAATEDMYIGKPGKSLLGALSIAVPGEIKGLYAAKERFGNPKITMGQLMDPVIRLCEEGFEVSRAAAKAILRSEKHIRKSEEMRALFVNQKTGKLLKEGDIVKRPVLARTLKTLKMKGPDAFYGGELGQKIVKELRAKEGIITIEDLERYRTQWKEPVSVKLRNGMTVYSSPPPGSGAVTGAIIKLLEHFARNNTLPDVPETYQKFAEIMKFTFAQRSKIGDNVDESFLKEFLSDEWMRETARKISHMRTSPDPKFYGSDADVPKDDHGTTHISVIDADGNAVSVTSTINYYFGSKVRSASTGIIFNNEMDDFATNPNEPNIYGLYPSKANLVVPMRRPTSSMSPTVIVDKDNNARLIIGASGGPQIITTTAFTMMQHMMMGKNIKEAIDYPRIHHQLLPMVLKYEKGLPKDTITHLQKAGHKLKLIDPYGGHGGGRVQAISINPANSFITANSDRRKGGDVDGY